MFYSQSEIITVVNCVNNVRFVFFIFSRKSCGRTCSLWKELSTSTHTRPNKPHTGDCRLCQVGRAVLHYLAKVSQNMEPENNIVF